MTQLIAGRDTFRKAAEVTQREALLLALLAFTATVRVLSLDGYALNGDNTGKWEFVRALVEGGDLRFNHHTTRWTVILPGLLSFKLFGADPLAHFLPALGASLLQSACLYKSGELLFSRGFGLIAAVSLVMFKPWGFGGIQYMPGGFSAAYLALAVYFLLKYYRDPDGETRHVVACALAVFAAYLTKVPNLLALPGLLLALWLCHRNLKHLGLFCGILLGLFFVETAIYWAFIEELPLGRYSALSRHHLGNHRLTPVHGFWGLFRRYGAIRDEFWQALFYAFATSALANLVCFKLVNRGVLLVVVVGASFYLGMGLAVKSLNPLVPVLTVQDRYFGDGVPLMWLVVLGTLADLSQWGRSTEHKTASGPDGDLANSPLPDDWRGRVGAWLHAQRTLVFGSLVLIQLVIYTHHFRSQTVHPLTRLEQLQEALQQHYERGDPIVCPDRKPKALRAALQVFSTREVRTAAPKAYYSARVGGNFSFVSKSALKGKQEQQNYLQRYEGKKVLFVFSKRGLLAFKTATLTRKAKHTNTK